MRHLLYTTILICVAAVFSACGDSTSSTPAASASVSPSLSAGEIFDAAGTWKTESTTCTFPVKSQFVMTAQSLENHIQTFTTDGDISGGVVTVPSEGALDTQSGVMNLCYASTLAECSLACLGIVDAANHVDLSCSSTDGSVNCAIALQKQ